ncbi:hypothetical protein PV327_006242 [Microctonus hyperodae]|uniref:Grh/CP2 DB domain-containing protein n=1 Tax=Microctonus hyperodae TaxID=165561 RepID=A0AA39F3W9_MICHY|nr:hypothetical protein PV327_006242 [Microctonus hyperodae]
MDPAVIARELKRSTIRICFHDRRLQYTEKEQILSWQRARPGERLLEVDIPLSYGVLDIVQSSSKSSVEFMWDPTKEVGVYIKVNCISTEFTPKKHGGEKGVPFKINVETLLPGGPRLHAASCQIKVFKLKGADRKHKQDRDKILRRPSHEQEKYQPSYDCTVLSDIPLDSLSPFGFISQVETNSTTSRDAIPPQIPVNIPEGSSPISAVNSPVSESSSEDSTTIMPTSSSSNDPYRFVGSHPPPKNRNIQEAAAWLRKYFPAHESTFVNYSGIDLLNLTRQELVQFCGPLDGIRMYNEIIEKAPVPKLVIYCALETDEQPIWKIIRLFEKTSDALTEKLSTVFNLPKDRLHSILFQGPRGIHVQICNDLVSYMEKDSVYLVQILKDSPVGYFKLLLKLYDG